MSSEIDADAWVALPLAGAYVVWVVSGGVVRGGSKVPGDAFFRSLSRATWWLGPLLVTGAACATVWFARGVPLAAGAAAVIGGAMDWLVWRWRPSRADGLWMPRLLVRARESVAITIRDPGAWRRQLCQLVAGAALLLISAMALE